MQFKNSIEALEWLIGYKLGRVPRQTEHDCIHQSYDDAGYIYNINFRDVNLLFAA